MSVYFLSMNTIWFRVSSGTLQGRELSHCTDLYSEFRVTSEHLQNLTHQNDLIRRPLEGGVVRRADLSKLKVSLLFTAINVLLSRVKFPKFLKFLRSPNSLMRGINAVIAARTAWRESSDLICGTGLLPSILPSYPIIFSSSNGCHCTCTCVIFAECLSYLIVYRSVAAVLMVLIHNYWMQIERW